MLSSGGVASRSSLFLDVFDRFAGRPLFDGFVEDPTYNVSAPVMQGASMPNSGSFVLPEPPKRPPVVEYLLGGHHQQPPGVDVAAPRLNYSAAHLPNSATRSGSSRARSASARSARAVRHRVRADNWMPMTLLETTRELFEQLERKEKQRHRHFPPTTPEWIDHSNQYYPQAHMDELPARAGQEVEMTRAASAPSTVLHQQTTKQEQTSPAPKLDPARPAQQITPMKNNIEREDHTKKSNRYGSLFDDDAFFLPKPGKVISPATPQRVGDDAAVDLDELNRLLDERTPSEMSYQRRRAPTYKLENVDAEQKQTVLRGFADFCNKKKKMPKSNSHHSH